MIRLLLRTGRAGLGPLEGEERTQVLIGDLRVDPVSDGTFVARPEYFGQHLEAGARPDFFSRHGAAWLPIGCFVIRAGDRIVLVDAGLGPDRQELTHDMHLVGGQLLTGLRTLGVALAAITDVISTHLHADHVGWLFGLDRARCSDRP